MRGRPATNRPYPAAPVRLRRPYNAENYFPRPLQRVEPLSLQLLPALACGLCWGHPRRGPVPVIYL